MRKIWFQIHWFLGIFLFLFLSLAALSGAVLSFEKEIITALNPKIYNKTEEKKSFVPSEILEIIQQRYPKGRVMLIMEDKEAIFPIARIMQPGQKGHESMFYAINPDTKEVTLLKGEKMFKFMDDFHRRLSANVIGKEIVAFTTLALLVLTLSGVYLYWGRLRHRFFASFKIDFRKKGRAFLYQFHCAIGMWLLPWYLLMTLSGLYWSYGWVTNTFNFIAGVEVAMKHGGHGKKMQNKGKEEPQIPVQRFDEAWQVFANSGITYEKAMMMLFVKGKMVSINYLDATSSHPEAYNAVMVDTREKKVAMHKKFEDLPLGEQLAKSMVVLHSGEYFGRVGQISVFIASLGMGVFVITGWMLYLDRRKKKKRQMEKI